MSEKTISSDMQESAAFCVRLPIFSRDKDIWGYDLICDCTPSLADGSKANSLEELVTAFRETLVSTFGKLADNQKLVLHISNEDVFGEDSGASNWENCVFCLGAKIIAAPACNDFVDRIRNGGGTIAVEGDIDAEACGNLLSETDFIVVSLADKTPQEVVGLRKKFKDHPGKLMVRDVSTWHDFEGTRALGFDYFQGAFFKVPEVTKDRDLSVSAAAKLQLMKELGNPDCEFDELARIISSDVSLSYRILKYINSASMGLKNEIKSIQQAVSLLGLKEVRHWGMVVIMTGLDSSGKGEELGFIALQRARFLSQLVEMTEGISYSANSMFMLGLFSKLDALLSYPMDKALENIPMDREIRAALCGVLNDYRDWLLLLDAIEIGNWEIANKLLAKFKVNFCVAATQYMKSAAWAKALLPEGSR